MFCPLVVYLLTCCLSVLTLNWLYNFFVEIFAQTHYALLAHSFKVVLITMIRTTIDLSLIYALLLKYWKNLSYPKFLPTSTLTIYTILVNQHIVQVTALKQLFWKLFMICSFLFTKATYLY